MSSIWLIRLSLSSQALALALAIAYNPSYPRPSKQRSGVLPHGFYQQVAPSLPCPVSRHRNSAGLSHLKVDAGAARPLVVRLGVVLSLSLSLSPYKTWDERCEATSCQARQQNTAIHRRRCALRQFWGRSTACLALQGASIGPPKGLR